MILRPTAEVLARAEVVVDQLQGDLARLLPKAEVEHIGATSHPHGWTKGDVDLSVLVTADQFDAAVDVLKDTVRHRPTRELDADLRQLLGRRPGPPGRAPARGEGFGVGLPRRPAGPLPGPARPARGLRRRQTGRGARRQARLLGGEGRVPPNRSSPSTSPAPGTSRERRGHLPRRPAARPAVQGRLGRASASPSASGATPTRRRSCSPTAGSTSPAPTTCSPRCWPPAAGGSWRGTTGATATPSTPRSTAGRPTSATPWPCSTRSAPVGPMPFVGHSKGGGDPARPRRGPAPPGQPHGQHRRPARRTGNQPDRSDHERTRMLSSELAGWLDHRRAAATQAAPARHARRAGRAPAAA